MHFLSDALRQTVNNLRRDRMLWRWSTWKSAARFLFGRGGLIRETYRPWRAYKRRDFHPRQQGSELGVQWLRTVHTYRVAEMRKTLIEAFTTDYAGLKIIVAEGECQLERQRRIKPWLASLLQRGERVVRVRYGVDEDVCNGDHACIRLSGCPTLTIKDNPDPLKVDPVATVIDGCVGCGLCGENAHAATLCPSFYRAEVITNPKWHERLVDGVRGVLVRALQA